MSDNDKPELWGTDQCSMLQRDPDEAIEAELDGWEPPLPPFLTVHGWAPTRLGLKHGDILDRIMEDLAGDHQSEDGEPVEPSQRMIDAEKELVDAFQADYRPTLCQIVPGHDIEVNLADWVHENAPGWLEENPDLLEIAAESARAISIYHLGLPSRVRNDLRRLRIYDVGQVLDNYGRLEIELPKVSATGSSVCRYLDEALKRIGVSAPRTRTGAPA